MQNDELLDLVNENDEVVGTVYKSVAHKDPKLFHREITIFIFNHKGETLLQQRSSKKKVDPLKWEVACAGHIGAGEDPLECANRELEEELGIKSDLNFIGKVFEEDLKNTESKFYWLYYGFYELNDFKLQEEEVEAVRWIKISEFADFYKSLGYSLDELTYTKTMEVAKSLNLL